MQRNKLKVLIACTNYNSDISLLKYLKSINLSFNKLNEEGYLSLSILVADNSNIANKFDIEFLNKSIIVHHIFNNGNYGYIGGITEAFEKVDLNIDIFDFLIISNVDVEVSPDFFTKLIRLNVNSCIGWIAPSIVSKKEIFNRNPAIISRPTAKKLRHLLLLYKYPILHFLYEYLFYSLRRKKKTSYQKSNIIYAGHGSFMIFTKQFLLKNRSFKFPSFLFGEEIFFAELILKSNLQTIYIPELEIIDEDHVSTGKMKKKVLYKMHYESIKKIYQLYF